MVARIKLLHDVISVNVAGMLISLSHCVKSLGVIFDENLNFNDIKVICKGCFFHMLAFYHMRPSTSAEIAKMVTCTIVGSRLDYCNLVLTRMSYPKFNELEQVQYRAEIVADYSSDTISLTNLYIAI